MKNFKRTGVFSTEEEKNEIIELHKKARITPVIYFGNNSKSAADYTWEDLHKRIHELALAHDLPEIEGYYGFDPEKMEFITQ